jgi:chromate transporter
MLDVLLQLILLLAPLSLVAVGGANAVYPEIHRQVVEVYAWLTDAEFATMIALTQAVPGPNIILISLIGWKVAGPLGSLVAMLAICGPSSLLAFAIAQTWERFRASPWRRAAEAGLGPITVGLVLASGAVLTTVADTHPSAYIVTAAAAALTLLTKLNPLLVLALAAGVGLVGWV